MQTVTLTLPKPHSAQRPIIREARRFNVLACGRRWGKTTVLQEQDIRPALEGWPVGWFAPSYKLLLEAWQSIMATVAPLIRRSNANERRIELITGGVLEFWSLDDPDAGRSRKYKRAIIDEAGLVKHLVEIWHAAIRPTLADYAGDAWFAGTPKGRNGFWELWQLGQCSGGDWCSWQQPTWNNPYIPPAEIAAMRASMPALLFAQEIEAAFVEDALTLFTLGDIEAASKGAWGDAPPRAGREYQTSVDIGRRRDATIINTLDITELPYQRVAFERLERVSYPIIQQHIEVRARRYPGKTWVEYNGVGDPVIENLDVPVETFITTAKSKMNALQALQLLFERHEIKAEWEARERKALISAAWDDDHTADEIMSLAIGAHAIAAQMPLQVFI